MKRLLAFALIFTMLLTGCSGRNPSTIAYEALVPQSMAESPLYQEALKTGGILCINGDPVTSKDTAEKQLARFTEEGEALTIYDFSDWADPDRSWLVTRFEKAEDGSCHHSTATYAADWSGSADKLTFESSSQVTALQLNRYGYLLYQDPETEEQMGIPIINQRDLFADYEETQRLKKTYLDPIYYTALMPGNEWSSFKEAGSAIFLAEDITRAGGKDFFALSDDGNFPVNTLVEILSPYFDGVDRSVFTRSSYPYDAATDTIFYEGGRGGLFLDCRVTTSTQEGDRLRIAYQILKPNTGEPAADSSFVLTVQLLEDGGFRYLSNLKA